MDKDTKQNTYSAKLASRGGETVKDQHEPIQAQPLEVKVYDNFDRAFRAFKAIVQKERILSAYKEKQSYEKPSVKRRRKRAEARRKAFEAEQKQTRHRKSHS
jgi:small subunit ribosomal protein S21